MTDDAGYAVVPRWMIRDGRFTRSMLMTYLALQSFADPGGAAFPSLATLAARARLAESTTRDALRALEAVGVVETRSRLRDDGGQRSNTYVVLTHDPRALADPPPLTGAPPTALRRPPHRSPVPELPTEELSTEELDNLTTLQYSAASGEKATEGQKAFLRDLHIEGGGRPEAEVDAWIEGLTIEEADAEIREAKAVVRPKGRRRA